MTEEKKSGRIIAHDHMTVGHIKEGLRQQAIIGSGKKQGSLTTGHLKQPNPTGQGSQSGSSGSSGSSGASGADSGGKSSSGS